MPAGAYVKIHITGKEVQLSQPECKFTLYAREAVGADVSGSKHNYFQGMHFQLFPHLHVVDHVSTAGKGLSAYPLRHPKQAWSQIARCEGSVHSSRLHPYYGIKLLSTGPTVQADAARLSMPSSSWIQPGPTLHPTHKLYKPCFLLKAAAFWIPAECISPLTSILHDQCAGTWPVLPFDISYLCRFRP
jgi:hypothetical protein